ncbi:MAG TPA: glycosyltransferase family 2 protein [Anaerolineales bacterium]|nr:glycosyltransferase family 2 protein [Anaerolineales bacterium]
MSAPRVVAVILNTNRRDDSLACLASLREAGYPNLGILLLDNASSDGSVEAVRAAFPEVEVLDLARNLGYAGNNNLGIRAALERGADWVLVLNEDVVVGTGALARLMENVADDPTVGIAGPMVYHHDEPAVIQSAGGVLDGRWRSRHRGQNETDHGQYDGPRDVDWISGCALLVRREVVEMVGALDERFFYYWEETEWCLRARRAGWRIVIVPQAKIWHKGVRRTYRPGPHVTYYWTRNWLLTLAKHRAPVWAWLSVGGWILRTSLAWTLRPRWREMREHRQAMWQGARDFVRCRWGMRPV